MIEYGKYTYGQPEVQFDRDNSDHGIGNLFVGKFCSLAYDATIYLGGAHNSTWLSTFPFRFKYPWAEEKPPDNRMPDKNHDVCIGNDVWVGSKAIILSGVKIGDGAVIGAGAVISRSVNPYGVAVGNPAQIVKYRLNPSEIEQMLFIKWWDWPEDKIKKALPLLCSGNVSGLVEFWKKEVK